MGKSNKYYLIARNKSDFDIIDCGNTLEDIDIYTTSFSSEKELISKLLEDNKVNSEEVDLFIVCPKKSSDSKSIQTYNLLFSNKLVSTIAKQSLEKKLPSRESEDIINNFCYQMKNNSRFFNMVSFGKTKLYPKFVDYFTNRRFDNLYDVKYQDGCWVRKSYPLIRNIFDTFNIFRHKIDKNVYNDIVNDVHRKLIEGKLLESLSGDYIDEQYSLFDVKEFKDNNVLSYDKLIEVVSTFESLDKNVIGYDNNTISVLVNSMDELDDFKKEQLQSLLNNRLISVLFSFICHKKSYLDQFKTSEIHSSYERLLRDDYREIIKLLKDDKILENAYIWVQIYNDYLGEVNGYQKRKEDN